MTFVASTCCQDSGGVSEIRARGDMPTACTTASMLPPRDSTAKAETRCAIQVESRAVGCLDVVVRREPGPRYRLGPQLLGLGRAALDSVRLSDVLDVELPRLRDEFQATALAGSVHGDNILITSAHGVPHPYGLTVKAGSYAPFRAPAGPIYAAWASEDVQARWLDRHTPADTVAARHPAGSAERRTLTRLECHDPTRRPARDPGGDGRRSRLSSPARHRRRRRRLGPGRRLRLVDRPDRAAEHALRRGSSPHRPSRHPGSRRHHRHHRRRRPRSVTNQGAEAVSRPRRCPRSRGRVRVRV